MGLADRGRCKQCSTLLRADLSPQSLALVSAWGLTQLPFSYSSNYLGYIRTILCITVLIWAAPRLS
ncbi:hypothetical protein CEQ36_02235 [Yersinia intermedia]|nr:hypothetical protein A6J67_23245 [Yersinia sp. FDAARGOS_228]AVL34552.1 hypothetical protein CEQ36_02235 [Yersinia intermedia]